MSKGVRVGGSPWWPTSYRWAYGWPYGRGYRALSDEDRRLADDALISGEVNPCPADGDPPE